MSQDACSELLKLLHNWSAATTEDEKRAEELTYLVDRHDSEFVDSFLDIAYESSYSFPARSLAYLALTKLLDYDDERRVKAAKMVFSSTGCLFPRYIAWLITDYHESTDPRLD